MRSGYTQDVENPVDNVDKWKTGRRTGTVRF